jgi:F0F1-type ATP synthase assembly protein I
MAVMAREAWTDERLDDLNARVDRLEQRMEAGFAEMRTQFAAQNRMLIQLFGGMFATMLIGFLGVIVTQS